MELSIKNYKNVIVNCMYRTPVLCLDTFCENIESILCDAKSVKTIFMCGDLNVDLFKHEEYSGTKQFLDIMYSLFDNIFTNELRHNQ